MCCICGFELGIGKNYGAKTDKMTYCNFVIKKEYHFLQNIFTYKELKISNSVCDLETYYKFFETFLYVCVHLCVKYNKSYPINMLKDEKNINFMVKAQVGDFETLFKAISEKKVKNINFESTNKKKVQKETTE